MPHFRSRALFAPLVLSSLLCASGCRSERSKAENTRAQSSVSEVEARRLATRVCDVLHGLPARRKAECCSVPAEPILIDECVELVARSLTSHALELIPGALESCSADMEKALTGCDWVTPSEPLSPASCQRLFHGQLPAGSVCRSSLECSDTLHCEGTTPTKAGVCAAPGNVGAGCGTHIDALAAATKIRDLETTRPFCAEHCSLTSHKCEPSPPLGARCAASVNCARGQSCVQGVCSSAPRGQRGQSCAGASCEEGLRCSEGQCRELAAPGAACTTDFDCAAGGCTASASGATICGAKCAVSLALLKNPGAPGMRLPLRPRSEAQP